MDFYDFYMEALKELEHSEKREAEAKSLPDNLWQIADTAVRDNKEWLHMDSKRFARLSTKDRAFHVNSHIDEFLNKYFNDKGDTPELQNSLTKYRNTFVSVVCKRIAGSDLYEKDVSELAEMLSSLYTKEQLVKSFLDFCYSNKDVVNQWEDQYNLSIGDDKWSENDFKDKLEFIRTTLEPLDMKALIARITELQADGYNVTDFFKKFKGIAGGGI